MHHGTPTLVLILTGFACGAHAGIEVTFTAPESYTDASPRGYGRAGRAAILHGLARHLEGLAERRLPPGHDLAVEIRDIDLAGRFEPWLDHAYNVRVLREITWPRIELRYTMRAGGAVVVEGEDIVSDLNYLRHGNPYFAQDRLRYEKRMLDQWFGERFGTGRPIVVP